MISGAMKSRIIALFLLITLLAVILYYFPTEKPKATKLYWFIPDGLRAEPDMFTIYKWAQEGKLPNIKKMMDNGAYGYSIPVFPSHTPTNFATLLTGSYPIVHGIDDGQMHSEGYPLDKPSTPGFSSVNKKVPPLYLSMENANKSVVLLSIPGTTPPDLKNGITIRGRWAPWGFDTPAVVFESKDMLPIRKDVGRGFRLFFLGQKLTDFTDKKATVGWSNAPASFSTPFEAKFTVYGLDVYGYIFDSANDNKTNYDKVAFSTDKLNVLSTVDQGEWSDWIPVKLKWQNATVDSQVKISVIKLWSDGNFRIRFFFNNVNRFLVQPSNIAQELTNGVGPMVDFVDNWPNQLIFEPEDKQTFLDEANMSLDWHKRAVDFIYEKYNPDVFIQDTYTPNQMLESRWWMGDIDKTRSGYSESKANASWNDILSMYQKIDAILGEAMKHDDGNTLFVLSSDHGVAPLHRQVRLNNLFADKGWLKFKIDNVTGEPTIDWNNSKVIFLKMYHVYINPNGLGGNWYRANGTEYEKLRNDVIEAIKSLQDVDGTKPLVKAVKWEDVPAVFNLSSDRVGDIALQAKTGYQWLEEMDENLTIFVTPLPTGYKQATDPTEKVMWTPFVIMGPDVKKGFALGKPISHIDQMPTILKLMGIEIPSYVQGRVLTEIISND
jgi:predicted AlkP superfamily phosphohydrolase/phosphomutase